MERILVNKNKFSFSFIKADKKARLGLISTPRGEIRTPAFMPVGTAATVKAMLPESVSATGADILLGNTYHLMLRPTAERISKLGGLHEFMNWRKPILTDSGGFQVMSLAELRKLTEEGVTFKSHIDGSQHILSPERSMDIQKLLGSDIVMCFDECPALPSSYERISDSMRLSMRWAQRSRDAFGDRPGYGLFGIQQGGLEYDAAIVVGFDETIDDAGYVRNIAIQFDKDGDDGWAESYIGISTFCLLYTSPSPRDKRQSRMPSSA